MELKNNFLKLMTEYKDAYDVVSKTKRYKNPLSDLIRKDIPECIKRKILLPDDIYRVKGSCGAGRWTSVPWIAIFDKRITSSAQQGIYIVYLLNKDTKKLYLTLNQGATSIAQKCDEDIKPRFSRIAIANNKETDEQLERNAAEIRSELKIAEAPCSNTIDTGITGYNVGAIYCKEYTVEHLPEDTELVRDLEDFILYYKQYYENIYKLKDDEIEKIPVSAKDNRLTDKEKISQVCNYIKSKGFFYENNLIENFYLSLKSKPFVILAGTSGTGKTRLVRLFAEAVGSTANNGRYLQVSVRPDWSDSIDLFGHVNLNNEFIPGAIIEFIKEAQENIEYPYFLCLDEMNLARVEYYLSEFLSVIETREITDHGRIVTDAMIPKSCYLGNENAEKTYKNLLFPENLYVIGTVNMDETTFPLSRKVLDRANTIEFSYVDLCPFFGNCNEVVKTQEFTNDFFKAKYLNIMDCADKAEYIIQICEKLQKINNILRGCDMHFGYRVRDEIVFYMLNRKLTDMLSEDEAFDNEILQKILPRIKGSGIAVKDMLCRIFIDVCAGEYGGMSGASDSEQMKEYIKEHDCIFRKSAEKIRFMVRRFEEDGFTSYWIG